MTNPNSNDLNARTNLRNFLRTAANGFHDAATTPRKRKALIALLLLAALLCAVVYWPRNIPAALNTIMFIVALMTFLFLVPLCAAAIGYVPGALEMQQDFVRVGFVNHAGESPYLIKKKCIDKNVIELTFYCIGFPLHTWVDEQLAIESALNLLIASVHEGKDCRTFTLRCVRPGHAYEILKWSDLFVLRNCDNLIIVGRGLTGDVIIDLNKTPHILLGGNSGSGKTLLLRCILWQGIQQSDIVYIADFKGGVDFGRLWHRFAHIITEEKSLLEQLNQLVATLGQFTRNYTQTVKRAADNKRRYAPGWVHSTCLLRGFPKGAAPHLAHDFAEQSVVCYTLCRRCPENTVAAGEGKGI